MSNRICPTKRKVESRTISMTVPVRDLAICAWCRQPFHLLPRGTGRPQAYCSRLHRDWAQAVAMGKYPLMGCPRCGVRDLRIAAPNWGICQTCGCLTYRHDLHAGLITPKTAKRAIHHIGQHWTAYQIQES